MKGEYVAVCLYLLGLMVGGIVLTAVIVVLS